MSYVYNGDNMSDSNLYLDKFLDALLYVGKFEELPPDDIVQKTLGHYRNYAIFLRENIGFEANLHQGVHDIVSRYAGGAPNLKGQCHAICQGLHDIFFKFSEAHRIPASLALTVGEVRYKGTSVYDVSKAKIKRLIRGGNQTTSALGVHCWVTLDDMTVYDPTIMPNLAHMGWIEEAEVSAHPIIVAPNGKTDDFEYIPMLVDNNFMARVDEVIGVV